MNGSSSNSRSCARISCVWKAAMPRRIPTATRTHDELLGHRLGDVPAEAASGRVPRNQPEYGMAVLGRPWHATEGREGGGEIARAYRDRPHVRHRGRAA